jgi:hypothetical protein
VSVRLLPLPRPAWATLAVVLLGVGIAPSLGFYSRTALAFALAALGCALVACLGKEGRASREGTPFLPLLSLGAVLLGGAGAWQAHLLYPESIAWYVVVWVAASAGFLLLLTFSLMVWPCSVRVPWFGARLAGLFVLGAVLRAGTLFASPDPVVDVFVWLRDAAGYLLQGQNPYAAEYESPYGTERAESYGVVESAEPQPAGYPPLPILLAAPFRAAGVDVRWVNVIADLLAAGALFQTARRGGSPLAGALLSGLYLNLPRAPFLIEQAWYEPVLAALLGWGLYLVEWGRPKAGCLLLALGLTAKQYGALLLPAVWRGRPRERACLALALAIVVAGVFLPFFLWGPKDFLDVVLVKHLNRPTQYASLTVLSGLHDLFGLDGPRWVALLPALLLIGWLAWRAPPGGTTTGLWMGTSLLVFCLCHSQGYFNYFSLCQYLWLLGIAGSVRCDPRPASSEPSIQGLPGEKSSGLAPFRSRKGGRIVE